MKRFFCNLFFVILPTLLFQQGFQVNLQGQKQQAMGSAGSALPQDAATLFYNPSGASFINKNKVLAGVSTTFGKSVFLDANTNDTFRTNSPVGTPFFLYALLSPKDTSNKFKYGLAVYTPFGSGIKWEDGWTGRFALTSIKLFSVFIQPTVSYRVNEKLSFGGGLVYADGAVTLQKDIPVLNAEGNYASAKLNGNANGLGYNLGVSYKLSSEFQIALSYRSGVKMKVKNGTAEFNVPSSLEVNFPNGSFTSSLPLPSVSTLGFAYKASNKYAVALDINYVGWSAYKALEFDYEKNTSSLKDTRSERNYKNTFAFRLGGQYLPDEKTVFRLGVSYVITPVPSGYVTPETPDASRLNIAGGISKTITKNLQADFSFTFQQLQRSDKNLETNLEGTYKTFVYIPGIGIQYSF
ncbi:MAG: OmpP1/FadL family transporter [Bacteroidota bacterium]